MTHPAPLLAGLAAFAAVWAGTALIDWLLPRGGPT